MRPLRLKDRYTMLGPLGVGGLGAVFEAHDEELDRRVAVKLLRQRLWASNDDILRLMREANAMARISHPNVVQVFDVGRYDTLPVGHERLGDVNTHGLFVVMELVRGPTMQQWLAVPRPRGAVLDVFAQAGRGLAAAHAQGVVHRDFKPANVLLAEDGTVKVTDFGLAAACEPSVTASVDAPTPTADSGDPSVAPDAWLVATLTSPGIALGTPAYMAPEQHRNGALDARTDQYAFCVALAEGLYGERPFLGTSLPELFASKLQRRLPVRKDVPRRLSRLVERGTSPSADGRFDSMDELLGELRRPEHPKRRPAMLAAGGLAIGLAIAISTPAPQSSVATPPVQTPSPSEARPSVDARSARERTAIAAQLESLRHEVSAGVSVARQRRIRSLRARARALGEAELIVDADLLHAGELAHLGDKAAARATAEAAYRVAEDHQTHTAAARAAVMMVRLEPSRSAPWQRWVGTAELHLDLAEGDPHAELNLAQEIGMATYGAQAYEESLGHWERVARLSREIFGEDHVAVASALAMTSRVEAELGDFDAAIVDVRRALEIVQIAAPLEHAFEADLRRELGTYLHETGQPDAGIAQLELSLQRLATLAQPRPGMHALEANVRLRLGRMLQARDRHDEAVSVLKLAIPHLEQSPDRDGLAVHRALADSHLALGRRGDAIAALEDGLGFVDADDAEPPTRTEARTMLAQLRLDASD